MSIHVDLFDLIFRIIILPRSFIFSAMEPPTIRPPLQTFISVESHDSVGNGNPYPKEIREIVMQRHVLGLPMLDEYLRLLQLHHLCPSDETIQRWITRHNAYGHFYHSEGRGITERLESYRASISLIWHWLEHFYPSPDCMRLRLLFLLPILSIGRIVTASYVEQRKGLV